ncbi:MAG: protoporphyrinogen oxidase [Elusimicrobia bacterium]|nr:protoporphyrinogen oxidase [Elusimicrobiota bacterium]
MKRAVLLIGFGGPDQPGDIRPFLSNVLRGRAVPPHRVEEVARQYERIGGRSPYNDLAASLARELEQRLTAMNLPVVLGMRHWAPTLKDTLARLKDDGVTDIVGVVLAAYRSLPSWNYYLRSTAEAFHDVGGRFRLRYVSPWHGDARFEAAVSARVQEVLEPLNEEDRAKARWYFTAHSIPTPWDEASGYSKQIKDLCARTAARFKQTDWRLVYQSRSGRPEDPWLEPDVAFEIGHDSQLKDRDILLIPVGFLMDHVEVLFDLDIKAREASNAVGARYHRAKTVGLHPTFLDMLTDKVQREFDHLVVAPFMGHADDPLAISLSRTMPDKLGKSKSQKEIPHRDSPIGTGLPSIGSGTKFSNPPGRKGSVNWNFQAQDPFSPGPFPRPARRVVVVGGGISGLSAAYRVQEHARETGADVRLTVLDAGKQPGGVVETGRRDGFLWEGGPDSFITEKPAALALARTLGMEFQVIGTNKNFQQSFIARGATLLPTPEGFYLLAPSKLGPLFRTKILSWPGKVRAAMELFIPPREGNADESLGAFVRRRFGQEVLDRLAQPMVAGIYSADPEQLSLQATFPKFLEMEKKGGVIRSLLASRKKGAIAPRANAPRANAPRANAPPSGARYGLFASFEGGVGSFVQTLYQQFPTGTYHGETHVQGIEKIGERWRLTCKQGPFHPLEKGGEGGFDVSFEADGLILAVPSAVASTLLKSVDPTLSTLLAQTPYGDVATVNVAVRRDRLSHPLNGFGFVVPAIENRTVTGCTFSSVKFAGRAPEGFALLRAFVGGSALTGTDEALCAAVLKDLKDFLGLNGPPEWMELRRYPSAMPQYNLGHVDRVKETFRRAQTQNRLELAGNGFWGIGLPDCVAGGVAAAERIIASLQIIESHP